LATALVLGCVCIAVWLGAGHPVSVGTRHEGERAPETEGAASRGPEPSSASGGHAWGPSPFGAGSPVDSQQDAPAPSAAAIESPRAAPVASRELDERHVCGEADRLPEGDNSTLASDPRLLPRPALARAAVLADTLAQGGLADRALGVIVKQSATALLAVEAAEAEGVAAARAQGLDARDPEVRMAAQRQGELAQYAPLRELALQLRAMADQTRSPMVWRLARTACAELQRVAAEPGQACSPMPWSEWAERDPLNGYAWLLVAQDASQRGDEAAYEAAMGRAADAQFLYQRIPEVLQALNHPELAPERGWAAHAMRVLAMAWVRRADPIAFGIGDALEYCSPPELVVPGRAVQCDRIVGLLAEQSDDPLMGGLVRKSAEALGWNAQRVAAMQVREDVYLGLTRHLTPRIDPAPFACERAQRLRQVVASPAAVGTEQWVRASVTVSGRSAEHWEAEGRAVREARDSIRSASARP